VIEELCPIGLIKKPVDVLAVNHQETRVWLVCYSTHRIRREFENFLLADQLEGFYNFDFKLNIFNGSVMLPIAMVDWPEVFLLNLYFFLDAEAALGEEEQVLCVRGVVEEHLAFVKNSGHHRLL